MTEVWAAAVYGLISGAAGTGAGGLAACLLPGKQKRAVSFLLEFSAGLMLSIVCFELLPQSFAYAPLKIVLAGLAAGISLMVLTESLIRMERVQPRGRTGSGSTGMVIALGIAFHNFLEGMAVGSGFRAETALGLSIAAAILLHDVPEGVSIAIPLREGGAGRGRALLWTLAAGLPMGFGCLFGAWAGGLSPLFIAACLSVAGGAMVYIVFADMLPESNRLYGGRFGSAGGVLGLFAGVVISFCLPG